jgi:hypothetical protein
MVTIFSLSSSKADIFLAVAATLLPFSKALQPIIYRTLDAPVIKITLLIVLIFLIDLIVQSYRQAARSNNSYQRINDTK